MPNLSSLKELKLSRNKLKDFDSIFNLQYLTGLETLTLLGNQVKGLPEFSSKIHQFVPTLTCLDQVVPKRISIPSPRVASTLLSSPRVFAPTSPGSTVTQAMNTAVPTAPSPLPAAFYSHISSSLSALYISPSPESFLAFVSQLVQHLPPPNAERVASLTTTLKSTRFLYDEGELEAEGRQLLKNRENDMAAKIDRIQKEDQEWKQKFERILACVKRSFEDSQPFPQTAGVHELDAPGPAKIPRQKEDALLVDRLKEQLRVLQDQTRQAEADLRNAKNEAELWKRDLEATTAAREQVLKDLASKKRELGDALDRLEDAELTLDDLKNEQKNLEPDLNNLTAAISALSEERAKLQEEVLAFRGEVETAQKHLEMSRKQLASDEERRQDIEKVINSMQEILNTLETENGASKRLLEERQRELAQTKELLAAQQAEVAQLEARSRQFRELEAKVLLYMSLTDLSLTEAHQAKFAEIISTYLTAKAN